jgi:nucleoid DNA-binding protein
MATKKDLVEHLAKKLNELSEEDLLYAVDFIFEYIKDELARENRVEIRGFGSLSVRKRKYADKEETYNTIYYRMSKNVQDKLN